MYERTVGDFVLVCVTENAVGREIVDAAYRVHTRLGPGLLESVYEAALAWELGKRGRCLGRQVEIPVVYEGVHIRTLLSGYGEIDRRNLRFMCGIGVISSFSTWTFFRWFQLRMRSCAA